MNAGSLVRWPNSEDPAIERSDHVSTTLKAPVGAILDMDSSGRTLGGFYDVENQLPRHLRERASDHFETTHARKAALDSIEDHEHHAAAMREAFLDGIGGLSDERPPLNARTVETVERDGHRSDRAGRTDPELRSGDWGHRTVEHHRAYVPGPAVCRRGNESRSLFVRDMIRALDYLEERPDVDIANAGGTQV